MSETLPRRLRLYLGIGWNRAEREEYEARHLDAPLGWVMRRVLAGVLVTAAIVVVLELVVAGWGVRQALGAAAIFVVLMGLFETAQAVWRRRRRAAQRRAPLA